MRSHLPVYLQILYKGAEPEVPSLFDEMMAAQAAAKKEKEAKTQKAADKSFGGRFKKGFFSSSGKSNRSKPTTKDKIGKSGCNRCQGTKGWGKSKQTTKSETLSSIAKEVALRWKKAPTQLSRSYRRESG